MYLPDFKTLYSSNNHYCAIGRERHQSMEQHRKPPQRSPTDFDNNTEAVQWRKCVCVFNKQCWSKQTSIGSKNQKQTNKKILDLNLKSSIKIKVDNGLKCKT